MTAQNHTSRKCAGGALRPTGWGCRRRIHVQPMCLMSLAVLSAVFATGCDRSDQVIRRYRVTKPAGLPQQSRLTRLNPHVQSTGRERMLGAILPHGEWMWFFKLVGPPELLGRQKENFERFIRSITFPAPAAKDDGGEPIRWKLPAGWRQLPASGLRYATIVISDGPHQLELSVTALARSANTVLANVNRWRQMMSLPAVEQEELPRVVKQFTVSGETATLVDIESKPNEGSQGHDGAESPRQ